MSGESIKFYKVSALPAELEANAFYFVGGVGSDYAESYLTDSTATPVAKQIGNSEMINDLVDTKIGELERFRVVADIATRDAQEATGQSYMVLVMDASADATVDTGAALYAHDGSTGNFLKVAEYESMDLNFQQIIDGLVIDWSQIQNGPTSTPAQIDQAVTDSHVHANKVQLDKVGEDADGRLTYDGVTVGATWANNDW